MTERVADPQAVCPFVAFDDDRDFRSPVPDHRHRCFAENPAAPRALAHQAAYCLSGAFPGCPTFVDWARREAAPAKSESPVRSLRDPAGSPRPAAPPAAPRPVVPPPAVEPPSASGPAAPSASRPAAPSASRPAAPSASRPTAPPASRPAPGEWAAPPPWAGPAIAGAAAGAAGSPAHPGPVEDLEGGREADLEPDAGFEGGATAGAAPRSPAPIADDTPAFLAGRSNRPAPPPPPAWIDDDEWGADEPGPGDEVMAEAPPRRPSVEPRRAPVGYAPVAPSRGDRRAGGSRRDRPDPAAPSWEEPRRFEAYPTLKSRGAGGIPRPALYALVIVLVGAGLFATPFLLRGLGGGGESASPTPAASVSTVPSSEPSATPASTPEQVVYIVKLNDTLSKIAARYKVTTAQILAANPSIKNANKIAVGDRIVIPQPAPTEIVNGDITPAPSTAAP